MSIKDTLSKIFTFLNEEEIVLKDVKTTDGTILSYDGELVVGVEIFIVDETGRIPATDGEYILEDGTKLNIVDSKVEAIVAPEAPIEAPAEEAPAEIPASELEATGIVELKPYPWDQCIADQKKNGYDDTVAAKICGKIKEVNGAEFKLEMPGSPEDVEVEVEVPVMSGSTEDPTMMSRIEKLEQSIQLLAESFSKQTFKEEVKVEMKKEIPTLISTNKQIKNNQSNLSNIFKNMYK